MSSNLLSYIKSRQQTISTILEECHHHDFYTTFTSSALWPYKQTSKTLCRLLVLDSSFNPPTHAHANLLKKSLEAYPSQHFDASLLLFSTNNVDKQLTGASAFQRAQMMELMAVQQNDINIAVGFTPHGRFIDKAKYIQEWFKRKYSKDYDLNLYFIIGFDTLVRFMDAKYYQGLTVKEALATFFDTCRLICADRSLSSSDSQTRQSTFWSQLREDGYNEDIIKRIQLDPVPTVNTMYMNAINFFLRPYFEGYMPQQIGRNIVFIQRLSCPVKFFLQSVLNYISVKT
ncbi:MAG: hypothetical protein EXX96DRAFT_537575 [Benjaminiella poitrasii]|nr:MAG: hypothetical protein EXX96DRAFT_537575 [Benjaminiella poitrasii]